MQTKVKIEKPNPILNQEMIENSVLTHRKKNYLKFTKLSKIKE